MVYGCYMVQVYGIQVLYGTGIWYRDNALYLEASRNL